MVGTWQRGLTSSRTSIYASTLEGVLELAKPHLTNELADREALARILAFASRVPAAAVGFFGFERRLRSSSAEVDFAFSLSEHGLNWLRDGEPWPATAYVTSTVFERLPDLASTVWLESDTSSCRWNVSEAPSTFVALDADGKKRLAPPEAVASAVRAACAGREGADRSYIAGNCVAACPESVKRLQIGFMSARESFALRLCFLPMRPPQMLSFLRAISWPGDFEHVWAAVAPYAHLCDGFGVHVDVSDRVWPQLGVELLYDGKAPDRQPEHEPRWHALFEQLISDKLCAAEERDALLGWVSSRKFEAPLIERLIAGAFPSGEMLLHGTLYTGLQHVKLVFDADGGVKAKAYYGAGFEPEPYA